MRRVVIVAFPRVQTLDVHGPAEVFTTATQLSEQGGYAVEVVAARPGPLPTSSIALYPDRDHRPLPRPDRHAGRGRRPRRARRGAGRGARRLARSAAARRSRRVTSVCTGAFLLAEAGLLDGRRATTHWASCALLARSYPERRGRAGPDLRARRRRLTSAGVTAGMDLALALVEEDLGREVALETARWLVIFLQRPGGQSQFSAQLAAQTADREPLRDLQAWIADHLDDDLSRARRSPGARSMSPRNFARALPRRDRDDPGRLRRGRCASSAPARARDAGDLPVETIARLRLRHGRDDAARLRTAGRRQPGRATAAASARRRRDPERPPRSQAMEIAIPLYDRFTALDAVGPYEVLQRLPGAEVTFARRTSRARSAPTPATLPMVADAALRRRARSRHRGRAGRHRHRCVRWTTSASSAGSGARTRRREWTTSVCTGSLLLGAAGAARRARRRPPTGSTSTTSSARRVARPGAAWSSRARSITAAGVSSGIDMALHARGEDRRRRGRPGDPAGDRVRPAAAVRRRLGRQGAGRDRRAGARCGRRAHLACRRCAPPPPSAAGSCWRRRGCSPSTPAARSLPRAGSTSRIPPTSAWSRRRRCCGAGGCRRSSSPAPACAGSTRSTAARPASTERPMPSTPGPACIPSWRCAGRAPPTAGSRPSGPRRCCAASRSA